MTTEIQHFEKEVARLKNEIAQAWEQYNTSIAQGREEPELLDSIRALETNLDWTRRDLEEAVADLC